MYLNNGIIKVISNDTGLRIELTNGVLDTDMLILAIGIKPESQIAINAGLKTNSRGGIVVDKNMRTSDPDIFAVSPLSTLVLKDQQ